MKVHQIRLGHATNSSSTHSLIILPGYGGNDEWPPSDPGEGWPLEEAVRGEFGWEFFTAGSRREKAAYAAEQLRANMERLASTAVSYAVAEQWTKAKITPESGEYGGYVDHQSVWTLPRDWRSTGIDREFFSDLFDFLMRSDVVVLGGNDNTESRHHLDNGTSFQLPLPQDSHNHLVARKDPNHGFWTIFDRDTGTKIRMSFDAGESLTPTKATAPELIDIKITDCCPHKCAFCYQDSKLNGDHANTDFLKTLAWTLGDLRVFEVAIGGGEPTLHPDFISILESFRYYGAVPNFTTRRLEWLHDHSQRERILKVIGAFAYSVRDADDIVNLARTRDIYSLQARVHAQYVMGTTNEWEFDRLLQAAHDKRVPITLLGFKKDGRGQTFKPQPYTDWPTVVKKLHDARKVPHIGIDTALASEFLGQLAALGVPKWCYETKEGQFSMYIDAVSGETAQASYGDDRSVNKLTPYRSGREQYSKEIVEHFSRY